MLTKEELEKTKIATKSRNKEIYAKLKELGIRDTGENWWSTFKDAEHIFISDNNWSKNSGWNAEQYFNDHEYKEITVEELLKEEMRVYTVSEQFIKEAHKAACSTWKAKLEEQFPEVFPKQTYKIGNIFTYEDTEVLLAAVDTKMCCLIDIKDGNRYKAPVSVENILKITTQELNQMSNHFEDFKLKQ